MGTGDGVWIEMLGNVQVVERNVRNYVCNEKMPVKLSHSAYDPYQTRFDIIYGSETGPLKKAEQALLEIR